MGWIVPVAMIASSLIGSYLDKKKAQKAQNSLPVNDVNNPLYSYLHTPQFSQPTTSDMSGFSDTNSNFWQNMAGTSDTTAHQLSTPYIMPQYRGMQDLLSQRTMARLRQPNALPPGYETGGIRRINESYEGAGNALTNRLSEAGLAGSPAEAPGRATLERGRGGTIADFRNTLPLLERQMANEDMNAALSQIMGLGKGEETNAQSHTDTTQHTTGGSQSSTLSGSHGVTSTGGYDPNWIAAVLGASGANTNAITGSPNTFSNMASMLGFMYGAGMFGGGGAKSGPGITTPKNTELG